jgi:hypothetical protein
MTTPAPDAPRPPRRRSKPRTASAATTEPADAVREPQFLILTTSDGRWPHVPD